MFCPECGKEIKEVVSFCEECGYALDQEDIDFLKKEFGQADTAGTEDAVAGEAVTEETVEPAEEIENIAPFSFVPEVNAVDESTEDDAEESVQVSSDSEDFSYYLDIIKDLESKNKSYRETIKKLQQEVADSAEINSIKDENQTLKARVEELELSLSIKEAKIEEIKDKINDLTSIL